MAIHEGMGGPLDFYQEFNPTPANLESAHSPVNAAVPKMGMLEGLLGALQKYPISIATDKFAMSTGGRPVDKSGFDTTEMAEFVKQIQAMMEGARQGKGTEGGPQAGYVTGDAKADYDPSGMSIGTSEPYSTQSVNPISRRVTPPSAFPNPFGGGPSPMQVGPAMGPSGTGDPFGRVEAPMSPLHLNYKGGY